MCIGRIYNFYARHYQEIKTLGFNSFKRKLKVMCSRVFLWLYEFLSLIIFGIPIFLLALSCRKFFVLRIGELESRVFGHFVVPVEIYLSEKDLEINKTTYRVVDIFFLNGKVPNKLLKKKWNIYFKILPSFLLQGLYHFLLRFFSKSIHLVPYRHWKNEIYSQTFDIHNALLRTRCHIQFTDEEQQICSNYLVSRNMEPSGYICFFSRCSGYYGDKSPRNSSINLMTRAIKFLEREGEKCIRVGSSSLEKFNASSENIFDYSFCDSKSELLDLYIPSFCRFMISTGSGAESMALANRRPLLYVNFLDWEVLTRSSNSQVPIFIPKLFYWKSTGKLLTFKETVHLKINTLVFHSQLEKFGIGVMDNTENEILDAVKEMHVLIRGEPLAVGGNEIRQREFKSIFMSNCNNIYFETPCIGQEFIKKYEFLLE